MTQAYNQDTFWIEFEKDLARAQARVIVQSPFVSHRRLQQLKPLFSTLRKKNILICVFLQQPYSWGARHQLTAADAERNAEIETALEWFAAAEIHANLRRDIHEKLAIIDNKVLWEGSLNILSHGKTHERMRRLESRAEVQAATSAHHLLDCETCKKQIVEQKLGNPLEQFAEIRQRSSLTQRELGKRVNIDQSNIAKIESQSRNLSIATLQKLTNELDCKIVLVPNWILPNLSNLLDKLTADEGR
ncbi:MAG: helix-turn-helix domain-containing protein [Candidatus Obscuribacterales bacterium]|nr:helix-turn-helix domain-containing protein [Candidatus Obscuribacterales bacterium]